jgi:transcription factor SPN1
MAVDDEPTTTEPTTTADVADDDGTDATKQKKNLMQNLFGSDDEEDDDADASGRAKTTMDGEDDEDDDLEDAKAIARRRAATKRAKAAAGGKSTLKGSRASKSQKSKSGGDVDFDAIQNEDYVAPRTAEDDAFIDDEGVAEEDKWANMSDDEDGAARYASEAEESDDELGKLFAPGGKGKRRRKDEEMARMEVLDFLSKMEIAVEEDLRAYKAGKPAVKKLKLLPEVERKLKMVELHEAFLRHGLLTVLRMWLDLLPDGNLPNLTIRTSLIKLIEQLPVSTDSHERKDELKRSGLGRNIMFLSSIEEETAQNRTVCKKLIEKWSRPVYELSSHYSDIHVGRQTADDDDGRRPKKSKARAVDHSADVGAGIDHANDEPKYGEPGYRHHAMVPERSSTQYVKQPRLEIDPSEIKARTQTADQRRVRQLVGKVAKNKNKGGQAYTPSVEGRGLVGYQG